MSTTEEQKWHWSEGNKFALEGCKALLLINGAAAVSVLTFIGNSHSKETSLGVAMVSFSFGALCSTLVFVFCYATQLQYGNDNYPWALKWHGWTYIVIMLGVLCFMVGMVLAAVAFL